MQIADVCNRTVACISARDTVADAARLMRERHVGSLVVVDGDAGRRPVGMFTDRDIAVGVVALDLDPQTTLVGTAMRPSLTAVTAFEPLEHAVARMRDNGVRRLPVVDGAGKLVGVIAADDVIDHLAGEMSDLAIMISRGMQREAAERRAIS